MKKEPLCQHVSYEQVAGIVERFYAAVLRDESLCSYFSHVTNWPEHCGYITDFWWGMIGGQVENPRPNAMENGHRDLHFGQQELQRWLALLETTLNASLPPDQSDRWIMMARHIADKMSERGMLNQASDNAQADHNDKQ